MKRVRPASTVTELLATLSEVVRLRILRLLEAEELSVGEVAKVVQMPQSTVSRHLKVLADGGWLVKRNAGTATLYRLVMDDLSLAARTLWLAVRSQTGEAPEFAEDVRRLAGVLAERRMDSQAFFGRVVGEWDDLRTRLFGADFTARALLGLLPRNWTVADLGCGTGNASELLAPHVEGIVAVDQSEPMLEAARQRLSGRRNVRFAAGQLDRLPLADASVDAAVCVLVLHHVQEPRAALKEMRRVLRRDRGGGVALILDMVEHDREEYRHTMGHVQLGFSGSAMAGLLRDAGFGGVSVEPLPTDTAARGPGLFVATGWIG